MTLPAGWTYEPPEPDGYRQESLCSVCPECGDHPTTGLHRRGCSQPERVIMWGPLIPIWKQRP